MRNKLILGITLAVLPLTLAACGNSSNKSSDSSSAKTEMSTKTMVNSKAGAIVGSFNSKDKTVVGATLPGKEVKFTVPMAKGDTTYLHFAFMHAASGEKGWYFAPESDKGVMLSNKDMKNGSTKDITDKIGLFAAPDKSTSTKVTKDDGKLKFEKTDMFMMASVKVKDGKYVVTIKNNSKDAYKTPFSSGVWQVTKKSEKSFDHMPSTALSELATMGHHDKLLTTAKGDK